MTTKNSQNEKEELRSEINKFTPIENKKQLDALTDHLIRLGYTRTRTLLSQPAKGGKKEKCLCPWDEICDCGLRETISNKRFATKPSKVISKEELEAILYKESTKGINKDGDRIASIPCGNFDIVAEAIFDYLEGRK